MRDYEPMPVRHDLDEAPRIRGCWFWRLLIMIVMSWVPIWIVWANI